MNLSHILSDYFDSTKNRNSHLPNSQSLLTENHLPVTATACLWEVHDSPERFSRKFRFESKSRVLDFVKEILTYENSVGHDGVHKIDGLEVTVEVYTHDVNRITNIDQEYTQSVDAIYKDVLDFGY